MWAAIKMNDIYENIKSKNCVQFNSIEMYAYAASWIVCISDVAVIYNVMSYTGALLALPNLPENSSEAMNVTYGGSELGNNFTILERKRFRTASTQNGSKFFRKCANHHVISRFFLRTFCLSLSFFCWINLNSNVGTLAYAQKSTKRRLWDVLVVCHIAESELSPKLKWLECKRERGINWVCVSLWSLCNLNRIFTAYE